MRVSLTAPSSGWYLGTSKTWLPDVDDEEELARWLDGLELPDVEDDAESDALLSRLDWED